MPAVPENTVWYIEARPWNGPKDGLAGFAQVDPASRGSGVVVTFAKKLADGAREPRSYILTCAHVVRDSNDLLLEDIVCYPPGSGYVRTAENARRCGTFPNAEAQPAKVSPRSPCKAVRGPRAAGVGNASAYDWVLLEIEDPAFYQYDAVPALGAALRDGELTVIGFPFGAGTIAEKQEAEAKGRGKDYPFWKDGRRVLATAAKSFRPADASEPGIMDYEGPEETRPGMSGGGIFADAATLVALHRASTDPTMRRGAIRAEAIAKFLRDTYEMEFVPGTDAGGVPPFGWPKWLKWAAIAAGIGALLVSVVSLWPEPKPEPIQLTVHARHSTEHDGMVPVAGLKIGFESDQWPGLSTEGETDANGTALVSFVPNTAPKAGERIFGYLVCRNNPVSLGNDPPYILSPYGRLPDGATKEKQILLNRGAVECFVMGRKAYWGGLITTAISENSAAWSTPVGVRSAAPQNLIQEIAKISTAAGLSAEETQLAKEGWVEQLVTERPVVRLQDLEKYLPVDSAALRRIAASVGRLHVEGAGYPYSSSAFLIAENLVLLPEFALPSNTSVKMKIEFPTAEGFETVDVLGVVWRSQTFNVALCEIVKTERTPLKIGLHRPDSTQSEEGRPSLLGRKIAVIGFPTVDSRLPKEINHLFEGPGTQPTVMPGRIIAPTVADPSSPEISHDATTSGGVSGGPVVDLDSFLVVAMHKGGVFTGERKENQAVELTKVWEDLSFKEALSQYGSVATAALSSPRSDPLRLARSDRFVAPYNATFLGCTIALPEVRSAVGAENTSSPVLDYVNFSLRMHVERRMALFVAANIDRSLFKHPSRRADLWYYDPRIGLTSQFGDEIYAQNEFDRGHLIARSAVAWGPTLGFAENAAASVYYWTNATPQQRGFNAGGWSKLEKSVYEELHPESKRLSVFCGPVFETADIHERDAQVPRRFWMIGVYENAENAAQPSVHAFLAQQYRLNASLEPEFMGTSPDCVSPSTIQEIEGLTGLHFSIPK